MIIFVVALALRLLTILFGNQDDILSNGEWGRWVYLHGAKGFYEEKSGWIYSAPAQVPLFNLMVAALFGGYMWTLNLLLSLKSIIHIIPASLIWWWEGNLGNITSYIPGYIIWLKLPGIIADLGIAGIIYQVGKKIHQQKNGLMVAALYLFLPFSWYLSSLWGQVDQLVSLLALVSFIFLYQRRFVLSTLVFTGGVLIKPTIIFLAPFFAFYFFYQRPSLKSLLLSVLGTLAVFLASVVPFADRNPFAYFYEVIFPTVFFNGRYALATKTFNIWYFFFPPPVVLRADIPILGIPAAVWGYLALVTLYGLSVLTIIRKNNFKNLLTAVYIIAGGSYLFGTSMLDRYFYAAIVFMALLTLYVPKLLKWWILSALIFFVNLFYSWGYPFLGNDVVWTNELVVRGFSLIQVAVFLVSLYELGVFRTLGVLKKGKRVVVFNAK